MPSIRNRVSPRDVPVQIAAWRVHLTLQQFERVKYVLFDRGFPRPDETTGMYDTVAIDAWLDPRRRRRTLHGLTPSQQTRDAREICNE
jgi:hypothetical protein